LQTGVNPPLQAVIGHDRAVRLQVVQIGCPGGVIPQSSLIADQNQASSSSCDSDLEEARVKQKEVRLQDIGSKLLKLSIINVHTCNIVLRLNTCTFFMGTYVQSANILDEAETTLFIASDAAHDDDVLLAALEAID